MLQTKPTEHLMGITIQGDYNDFSELVDSIYSVTGLDENSEDIYYGVKNRLLGICYDIRHAYQGDRNVVLVDNNMNRDKMKWHEMITPEQNVYYSVEVLFPEAIFVAAAVPHMYMFSDKYYGSRANKSEMSIPPVPYSNMMRDKANLDVLCGGIWQALGQVIGDDELERIIHSYQLAREDYMDYATHYIDKCNIELYKTPVDKRKDKLRNIAKRIVKKPQAYFSMEQNLKYWAKEHKTTIYELKDPKLEYPEKIEW
ncbi:MAG: hypothetical protein PHY47_23505 [Lachnospiraceae bacterium]|nr:hypothetical protein [Lachnospiraceae bacterium]